MTETQPSSAAPGSAASAGAHADTGYPDNPVLSRVWRGDHVESQHRGAWVLVDSSGRVLDGAGAFERPTFVRSAIKCVQALPLVETGAADALGYTAEELALACASHSGEAAHVRVAAGILERLGLDESALRCGSQPPFDKDERERLVRAAKAPTALHNNCSGKHAGFLALAHHLGQDTTTYLDEAGAAQRLVRQAVLELAGIEEDQLTSAIDGCSAPTWRLPLAGLATAFARVTTPTALGATRRAACDRLCESVAANPVMIAGSRGRLCTDLSSATGGRLFPKIGGEAVYAIGVRGADRGLAIKVDDGAQRGFHALVLSLLERFGFADETELARLDAWRGAHLKNWAGLDVGHLEVLA